MCEISVDLLKFNFVVIKSFLRLVCSSLYVMFFVIYFFFIKFLWILIYDLKFKLFFYGNIKFIVL